MAAQAAAYNARQLDTHGQQRLRAQAFCPCQHTEQRSHGHMLRLLPVLLCCCKTACAQPGCQVSRLETSQIAKRGLYVNLTCSSSVCSRVKLAPTRKSISCRASTAAASAALGATSCCMARCSSRGMRALNRARITRRFLLAWVHTSITWAAQSTRQQQV